MRRLALVIALAFFGCDADRRSDRASGPSGEATDATSSPDASGEAAAPNGVPSPVDTFGAAAVDVDRVVLTERTPLPSAGSSTASEPDAESGEAAHPAVWETTDPEWIESFIASVGPETRRVERGTDARVEDDCRPWADLTLYRDQTAAASFAVECPRDTFQVFRTRPPTHVFVASEKSQMAPLLQTLRGSEASDGSN